MNQGPFEKLLSWIAPRSNVLIAERSATMRQLILERYQVFTLLLIWTANLVVAEQPLDRGPADVTIENAKIFLPGTSHVAMAIKANRIVAVGSKADIEPLIGAATKRLDARGCSVTPGFNDAHVHFLSGSLGLSQVELSDEDSITTIEEKIRIFMDKNPNQPWIVGRGWVYGTFPAGLPTKEQLDRMVANRPAIRWTWSLSAPR